MPIVGRAASRRPTQRLLAIAAVCAAAWPFASSAQPFADARARLVREIEETVRATERYTGIAQLDGAVLEAIATVPRHEFVPEPLRGNASLNRPLPIGFDQTISQPYIVALMTALARVDGDSVVLEIGTGSGYQAAVLGELARDVYTIEIVEPLGRRAAATLERLGYENVHGRIGDGYAGWPEHAPFDAIVVTAAPEHVPQPLIEQLASGGRLVIPVGSQRASQTLEVHEKTSDGEIVRTEVLPVAFVPLTR